MTAFELTSVILLPILVTASSLLAMALGKEKSVSGQLALTVVGLKMNQTVLISQRDAALKEKVKLKETTEKLLRLAVKSDTPHEASAAAVQACKRIYVELGIK